MGIALLDNLGHIATMNASPQPGVSVQTKVTDRPPILEATRSLGINDRRLGKLMGIAPEQVHKWATGKTPIPVIRQLAMLFLVTRLTGIVGAASPPQTRYARRAATARDAAKAWCALANDELHEDLGGVFHAEQIERGIAMGELMIAQLEAT
jgi:hypothetical protein